LPVSGNISYSRQYRMR